MSAPSHGKGRGDQSLSLRISDGDRDQRARDDQSSQNIILGFTLGRICSAEWIVQWRQAVSVKVVVFVNAKTKPEEATFPTMPRVGDRIVLDPVGPDLEVFRVVHYAEKDDEIIVAGVPLKVKSVLHARTVASEETPSAALD